MQVSNQETNCLEAFEELPVLAKYKGGDDFNRSNTCKYFEDSAKASLRAKFEPDTVIGQKGWLCKGLV